MGEVFIFAKPDKSADFSAKILPKNLPAALLGIALAVIIAGFIFLINGYLPENAEKSLVGVGAMFAIFLIIPPVVYLAKKRSFARISELGLIVIAVVCLLLVACYLFYAGFYIAFRGDFFIWSESDFVNDILKFRQGYPIFSAQVNNESFAYMPGSQLLTYFFAWLIGQPTSIQVFRAIQLGYTFLAAIVAFLCCRRLLQQSSAAAPNLPDSRLWGIVWLSGLFLVATNYESNPFTHLLHNDALAQLVAVTGYWLLLEYEQTKDKRFLWLMALIPLVGFWVKQSLAVWAVLYVFYLLVFDRPRSFSRVFIFAMAAFGGVFLSYLAGYLIWGDNFIYWVFTVLGKHSVSPLRSFQHLLEIWTYFVIGILGGIFLIENSSYKKLFGHWLIWLIFISIETYTSGVAWMLNHIGPGCLIAGIWFFAALAVVWERIADRKIIFSSRIEILRAAGGLAVIGLIFSGLNVVNIPVRPFGDDAERYIGEIEREFDGQPRERVLLDFGTWLYLPAGTIMKDRAPTIGERGYSQIGDFSGIVERLDGKFYTKILVRNLHSPDFWYDHELWTQPSGIRQALLDNYREIRIIKKAEDFPDQKRPYGFQEISVLIPRE